MDCGRRACTKWRSASGATAPCRGTKYATRRVSACGPGDAMTAAAWIPMLADRRFDLPQLDAEASDLDLTVAPAQILDGPVGEMTRQITGTIEPRAPLAERIRHECLRRLRRLSLVASADRRPCHTELPGGSHHHLAQVPVDDMKARVDDGPPDRS